MRPNTTPSLAMLRTIWAAIALSPALLLVVVSIVERPEALTQGMLVPIFGLVAASTAGLGLVFPTVFFRSTVSRAALPMVEQPDPDAPEGFRKVVRVPADPAAARQVLLAAYGPKTILGVALGESIALLGFVLGMLGLELPLTLPFYAVSWLVIGTHFPRESSLSKLAEQTLGWRL